MNKKEIYAYDFDGVVRGSDSDDHVKIVPEPGSIIITGRAIDEAAFVRGFLDDAGIECPVYHNFMFKEGRLRSCSGEWKSQFIKFFNEKSPRCQIVRFYEDDPVQLEIIKNNLPALDLVYVENNQVEK